MRDKLGPGTTLSYCTNVHPITGFGSLVDQLQTHAIDVRNALGHEEPLAVGLYLPLSPKPPRRSAINIVRGFWNFLTGRREPREQSLASFLRRNRIDPVTANAFPIRFFHEDRVKHNAYESDWRIEERLDYSLWIAQVMHRVAPSEEWRSISTLPLRWGGHEVYKQDSVTHEAEHLRTAADELSELAESHDGKFTLDLEPEPGCILDTCDDVIAFFDEHLPGELHRKHIGVCHDVCHAAVMFEDQREVLRRYAEAGIRVNKVQISSALDVDVRTIGVEAAIKHLRPFAEPRYLHQTGFLTDGQFELIEDLPEAIERLEQGDRPDRLRVHFHVPVYLDSIGPLGTTNNQIAEAVAAAREYHDTKHFEVETYAWGVLPDHLKRDTLAAGIADELKWVLNTCGDEPSP